jgi:23S rRNA (guanine745-N1)-methyltransferase
MALADVLDLLCCPQCAGRFRVLPGGRSVACPSGHTFDVARQGYLNLLGAGQPGNADTAAMVAARQRFLSAGHYRPVEQSLRHQVERVRPSRLLDVGTGTGHYLAAMLHATDDAVGVGIDVSVPACRRAAAAHPRLGAVVADVWRGLPVRDETIDLLSCVFAPRNAEEFRRVLRPGGAAVVVHPLPEHLHELRSVLGLLSVAELKAQRLAEALTPKFEQESGEELRFPLTLGRESVIDLVGMGPNAFHADAAALAQQLATWHPETVTAAVAVSVWARR